MGKKQTADNQNSQMQLRVMNRRKKVFEELSKEDGIHTKKELAEKFSESVFDLENDVTLINELLIANGFNLKIKYSAKNGGYRFRKVDENVIVSREELGQNNFDVLFDTTLNSSYSKYYIQKLLVQVLLNRSGERTLRELANELLICSHEDDEKRNDKKALEELRDILYGNPKKHLEGMIKEGIVHERINESGQKVFALDDNSPYIINLKWAQADNIRSFLSWFHHLFLFSDDLLSVQRKLEQVVGEYDDESQIPEIGAIGLSEDTVNRVKKQKRMIESVHYKTNALHITYENRSGFPIEGIFRTGLVIFNDETGQYHLAGKMEGDERDTIINVARIREIKDIKETENDLFENPHFCQIRDESLIISSEEPFNIKIRFKDEANIREKLKIQIKGRSKARLYDETDKTSGIGYIIYEDTVRGFLDATRFARKYGKSAEVLEPIELKDRIVSSLKTLMERYREEGLA